MLIAIARPRGLSIVEFMVGIVVGLIVVGGAVKLFTDYAVANKRLVMETRVNQDLRAAADIVMRDVRRAGYWNNSLAGVWGTGAGPIASNPHLNGLGNVTSTASSVSYSYARATAGNTDGLDSNEYAGFRVASVNGVDVLQMQDGQDSWQSLTDPGVVRVTAFNVTEVTPALTNDLSSYCGCLARLTCTLADIANPTFNPAGPPTLTIPSLQITITGQAVNDPSISRTLSEAVRVRNARLTGSCPP